MRVKKRMNRELIHESTFINEISAGCSSFEKSAANRHKNINATFWENFGSTAFTDLLVPLVLMSCLAMHFLCMLIFYYSVRVLRYEGNYPLRC